MTVGDKIKSDQGEGVIVFMFGELSLEIKDQYGAKTIPLRNLTNIVKTMKVKIVYSWEMGVNEETMDLDKLADFINRLRKFKIYRIEQYE